MNDRFQIVGARPLPEAAPTKNRHSLRGKPVASAMILSLIVLACLFCELIMTKDPTYLDLAHCSAVPCREFLFGTDTMGRDIFSMIWYGGRLSLFIGVGSTVISTLLAILFGAVSGLAPKWLDAQLHGPRPAHRGRDLGQHALARGKSADDRRVVDLAHPRRIFSRDTPLHHKPRRLPAQPHEQKRKQPVNSKKKAQPFGCAFLSIYGVYCAFRMCMNSSPVMVSFS